MEKKDNKNMLYYEQLRSVPQEAIKTIAAGRLQGMSDINPMWRIKAMTKAFGVCGIGWKYEITKQWQEVYGQEVKAFTNINLYVKVDGQWSEPIPGTGGATIVEINKRGAYVNDEGYKMSLTDALSVAMKSLGVAADVYFNKDAKYDTKYEQVEQQPQLPQDIINEIAFATTQDALVGIYNKYTTLQADRQFLAMLTKRKEELQ